MKHAITLVPPKDTFAKAVDPDNPPWSEEMLGPPVKRRGAQFEQKVGEASPKARAIDLTENKMSFSKTGNRKLKEQT